MGVEQLGVVVVEGLALVCQPLAGQGAGLRTDHRADVLRVVVDVQRSYWPRRLPKKRPEVLPPRPITPKNQPPIPEDDGEYVHIEPAKELVFESEEEKEEIARLGCLQWNEYKKLIRIVKRERIKADGWPPRVPPRKGKKRGPKKNANKRARSLAQDRADLNKFYDEYRKKMEKYGL